MSAYGSSLRLFEDLDRLVSQSYRILVPSMVIDELKLVSGGKGRAAAAARLGLMLAARYEPVPVVAPDADHAIVKLAKQYGDRAVVCTNDAHLKNILKEHNTRVIGVRDYSHLDFL